MWEDFRHGLALGTGNFLDHIKIRYAGGRPYREVPRQEGLMGRIDVIFGITHTAVSHIVKPVKGRIKTDHGFQMHYRLLNSQIKM